MVRVAQLVELQIVVLAVAGSNPVAHPNLNMSENNRSTITEIPHNLLRIKT
jgi:hypothetical protein